MTIAEAFGRASRYHETARVQRVVAAELAERLARRVRTPRPRVLELGCGSGFLSQSLLQNWPEGSFLITDVAAPMVERCRQNLTCSRQNRQFVVMDCEDHALRPGYDLITASLAFQWLQDFPKTLRGLLDLLAPGGILGFSTLALGTFMEWQQACARHGVPAGTPDYPPVEFFQHFWPVEGQCEIETEWYFDSYTSGISFLRHLKQIGAHSPKENYASVTAGQLRRVLRDLTTTFTIRYHVVYSFLQKDF
ncbi:MAG: methyltransferase domain-containing protein [Magnetococcus sp. DMHC-6]